MAKDEKEKIRPQYTVCVPEHLSKKFEQTYNTLLDIDANFSKIIQCLLGSLIRMSKYIIMQKKNFRHYEWHIMIEDKETGKVYYTHKKGKKI